MRQKAVQRLNESGVDAAIHYPVPMHRQPALSGIAGSDVSLPVTERAADEVISLPVFPEMTPDERDRVMAAVLEAARR